jgi:hypothetical protein
MVRGLALIVFVWAAGVFLLFSCQGCCATAKRSCFPPCDPPTRVVVEVEKSCELPPRLQLAAVRRSTCPDRPTWACFEPLEGGKLAKNLAALKTWIREVRARCGPRATSQPTSRPSP